MGWKPVDVDNHTIDMAVHVALIPGGEHGRILYFGGYLVDDTHLFDITTEQITAAPSLPGYNIFCAGHAWLPDGRLLVAGGQLELGGAPPPHAPPPPDVVIPHLHGNMSWGGERRCSIYHPITGVWEETDPLNLAPDNSPDSGGRWYPTLCTLADGNVLAVGGHPDLRETYPGDTAATVRHSNNTPELFRTGAETWKLYASHPPAENQTDAHDHAAAYDYQRTHLLPNGKVFFASPVRGRNRVFDPDQGIFLDTPSITLPTHENPDWVSYYQVVLATHTSVMLPLLHQEGYRPRVLLFGDRAPKRIDLGDLDDAGWTSGGTRDWDGTPPRRLWATPVILPTGEVFLTGGTAADEEGEDAQAHCVLEGELYDPGVDWQNGSYTSETGSWQTVEPAAVRRHYHGTAILMTNGAVWTAGSNGPSEVEAQTGNDRELRWEVYEPWYFSHNRPRIDECPTNIGYGYQFDVTLEESEAESINRVALLRCGSMTHAFNPDQRYITVPHHVVSSNRLRVSLPYMPEILPSGRYLLWVINDANVPCEWAHFVRISKQKLYVTTDISTYSRLEVNALGHPAEFHNALYVVCDGFLPGEVVTPTAEFVWPGTDDSVSGVSAAFGSPMYEAGAGAQDTAQRIVFPCDITFSQQSDQAFASIPEGEDFRDFWFRATVNAFVAQATLSLSKNLNPRMSDGDPHWLSIDLRAFSTQPGETFTAGVEHGSGLSSPTDYIQEVLGAYNSLPPGNHPFDALPTDQETNRLALYSEDGTGRPIFNYAIARVRMRAPELEEALNVRVFFRQWTTGWTNLSYATNPATGSYPRDGDGEDAAPLLGMLGGEISTIPCFAEPREANMSTQKDPANIKKIVGQGAPEVHTYYGCWLDINQEVTRFPLTPAPGDPGPFSGDLKSIQELMRGVHQCLVAELHYWPDDPIPSGATPGSSDNLAQRNLLLDESDNPGLLAAHLVHHTFELVPSPFGFPGSAMQPAASTAGRTHPDELVVDWGGLPQGSIVTFYMPQTNASEILRFARSRLGPGILSQVDDHSLQCKVTDVAFVPIPGPLLKGIAGLATVQLPPDVTAGSKYTVVLRQVDGRRLRVVGTTQFDIYVKTAPQIRPRLERNFAVLKHIGLSIPPTNRWHPVFERYLEELGGRIRGMGGDPDAIPPSSTGGAPRKPDDREPDDGQPGHVQVNGKVESLLYDCFGEFEGFVLETCEHIHRYRSCEKAMERVVQAACRDRSRVTVTSTRDRPDRPLRVIVHCCG